MSSLNAEIVLEQGQYRLIGAIVWLALLVIIVPIWYNNPVNFEPENFVKIQQTETAVVNRVFTLPEHALTNKDKLDRTQEITNEADVLEGFLEIPISQPELAKKSIPQATENIAATEINAPVWIIRLIAYRDRETAEALVSRLKYDYAVSIRYFPNTSHYSVRVGPYKSEAVARNIQEELDRLLRVNSELVKIENPSKSES